MKSLGIWDLIIEILCINAKKHDIELVIIIYFLFFIHNGTFDHQKAIKP